MMGRYHISGSYRTTSGNVGSYSKIKHAPTSEQATEMARFEIEHDPRRRYGGKLNLTTQIVKPTGQ